MTIANKREQIRQSLGDPEYRHQFVEEEINVGIAFQIRSLRGRQDLTQVKLAELIDVKQSLISQWENPNYGKYTLGTLKELAKAFDVGLLVRFVPFNMLVDWTINLTSDAIAPPNFSEEQYYVPTSDWLYINRTEDKTEDKRGIDANNSIDLQRLINPEKERGLANEKGILAEAV